MNMMPLSRVSLFSLIQIVLLVGVNVDEPLGQSMQKPISPIVFVIHGGAGTINKRDMTPQLEEEYRAKLNEALLAGHKILKDGGRSLDAVEHAIKILEDSPLFNAGKGAVFTNAGTNELDASIMDGESLKAGAVAAVTRIKNPISLARLVMDKSPHVMMIGRGAEQFAKQNGISFVSQRYFYTERRWKALQQIKRLEKERSPSNRINEDKKHGTVGAVALDSFGNLAAGTSTGGMTNKRFGRVGDSPIIGAGTYADNESCAVSATGHGEYFIRGVIAFNLSALVKYKGLSLEEAGKEAIKRLAELGGTGGVIAIDRDGNITMPFNTEGMYRAYIDRDGKVGVEIY
jgi:L-asparaginase / beta-aspartyl-peptidase